MRISDWSSDVCSSDLILLRRATYPWESSIPVCGDAINATGDTAMSARTKRRHALAGAPCRYRLDHVRGHGLRRRDMLALHDNRMSLQETAMKVADVMTNGAATVRPDASLAEAARIMVEHGISGLPVVDESGRLVGILTEGDFLRRADQDRPRWISVLLSDSDARSEEHTSELQSLMRISYAVFCLKKKQTKQVRQSRTADRQDQ